MLGSGYERVDVVMFWSNQILEGWKIGLYLYSIQLSVFSLYSMSANNYMHNPTCVILHNFQGGRPCFDITRKAHCTILDFFPPACLAASDPVNHCLGTPFRRASDVVQTSDAILGSLGSDISEQVDRREFWWWGLSVGPGPHSQDVVIVEPREDQLCFDDILFSCVRLWKIQLDALHGWEHIHIIYVCQEAECKCHCDEPNKVNGLCVVLVKKSFPATEVWWVGAGRENVTRSFRGCTWLLAAKFGPGRWISARLQH